MELPSKGRFFKINESFDCLHCGAAVPPAKKTCRNHCPFCLHSRHVDVYPGDRANSCGGLLKPVGYELHKKKGLMLIFRCQRCQQQNRTIALLEDPLAADDYQLILSLSGRQAK